MLMLVVPLGMISCEKKEEGKGDAKTPRANHRPRAVADETSHWPPEQQREMEEAFARLKSGVSQRAPGPLPGVAEGKIVADFKQLVESSAPKPGTESSKKAEEALRELLARKSPEFYAMLSLLPPGDYSEWIVGKVFSYAALGLDEFREVMAKINEPDLLKAALNGAFNNSRNWKVGIAELESFEKLGLDDFTFGAFLVEGYKAELYSLEEVARNSTDQNNAIYNRLGQELSFAQQMEYCMLVYKNGRKIDSGSLSMMGYRLFQDEGQDAVAWAQQLPEEAGKNVVKGIFYEWTAADPRAASKYLAQMSEGILKDSSILGLVRNCVANKGAEEAAGWAAQIKDEKIRAEAQGLIPQGGLVR